jgi:hypothetical protein
MAKTTTDDVLWGVKAIAEYVRRSQRQTYYLIERKIIPANKAGHRTIVAFKSKIDAALAGGALAQGGDDD